MARLVLILNLIFTSLSANSYTNNCLKCHNKLPVSIDKYFYRYLLKYSSERRLKHAMINYLKKPNKDTTIMPEAFIKRFGIKKTTTLSDKELQKAINTYWEKYKVFGKLQ